ncbi:MAG: Holliday junction branch migration protein RuvA [Hydrogenothermaceae bacterium]|nr:Holliday junction branch migration protein RuvA [Hydrogenothermaceae bacterium]
MLDYIVGKVVDRREDSIIVDKDGFGFLIYVPDSESFEDDVKVYTYLHIKEEAISLYGFKSREERDLFTKLISLHGIGVKHAFSILSNLTVEEFINAIETQNTVLLSSIPGIGKKTAHRLIVELKGKLNFEKDQKLQELIDVLINLGYDSKKAIDVASEIDLKKLSLEDAVKESLKKLTNN